MRIFSFALLGAASLFWVACSDVECESAIDCVDPLVCEGNVCVKPSGQGYRRDAGPIVDVGVEDTGTSTSTPSDGGSDDAGMGDTGMADSGEPDSGMPPSGDAGEQDAGAPRGDAETVASGGEIYYAELENGVNVFAIDEWAELQDRSNATYAVVSRTFADFEGGQCVVRAERLISGTPTGYGAESIELRRTPNLVHSLVPVAGRPGRFEPMTPPATRIFGDLGDTQARVVSSGGVGQLADYTGPLLRPDAVSVTAPQPLGSAINVENDVTFMWLIGTSAQARVIELYDAPREVTLRCTTPNDGLYTVPPDAIDAWLAEAPLRPAFIELSTESDSMANIGVVGGGSDVPVLIRARRGARFSVQ